MLILVSAIDILLELNGVHNNNNHPRMQRNHLDIQASPVQQVKFLSTVMNVLF